MRTPIDRTLPSQMPTARSSFVGREEELEELSVMQRDGTQLMSIIGPPGTGKTRVALRMAELALAHEPPTPTAYADLGTATSFADACSAIGEAIGAIGQPSSDPAEPIQQALASSGRMLLILDHPERVLEELAKALRAWLGTTPTQFLISSRELLRLPQEISLELAPLSLPPASMVDRATAARSDAVALLLSRAPELELTEDNAALMVDVVSRLDGIPLAIELAAARIGVLGLEQLRDRLPGQLDLLSRAPRDAATHQSTLRKALDWSWDLLPAQERRALAVASVFRGGFSLEAFETLATELEVDHPIEQLQSLRDKSLLAALATQFAEPKRFRPYESVRTYARQRLQELGLVDRAVGAHARLYATQGMAAVTGLSRAAGTERLRFLTVERDNLLCALEATGTASSGGSQVRRMEATQRLQLAVAASIPLLRRGPASLALEILGDALARADDARDPDLHAMLLRAQAEAQYQAGQAGKSEMTARRGAEIARRAELQHELRGMAARAAQAQGQLERAAEGYEAAIESAGDENPGIRAQLDAGYGVLLHGQGKLAEALARYESALMHAAEAGHELLVIPLHRDIGSIRLAQGRLEEARDHYGRVLAADPLLTDRSTVAVVLGNLGILEQELGHFDEAAQHYAEAHRIFQRSGLRLFEAHLLGYRGGLELERGALDRAASHYDDAVMTLRQVGDRRLEGTFRGARCALEAARGRLERAREEHASAKALIATIGDGGLTMALSLHHGRLRLAEADQLAARGEVERANEMRTEVVELLRTAEEGDADREHSDDTRFAMRLLRAALGGSSITVEPDTSALKLPDGMVVDLRSRAQLRRIVRALVEHRKQAPGVAMTSDELLEAGWPGERIHVHAGANRLKVALSTLRKLGLRDVLMRSEQGYYLDPSIPIEEPH